jgi:hypothetical protein
MPFNSSLSAKGKGKVRPRIGHEGPDGEYMYTSILSLTSALDGRGWLTKRLGRFAPGKEARYPLFKRVGRPQGWSEGLRRSYRDYVACKRVDTTGQHV